MPPNRMESTTVPDEAAATAAAAAAPSGGLRAWLPLLITVLVMPALAYAMTSFVLLPRLQRGLGIAASSGSNDSGDNTTTGKQNTVMLNKLLVNVAGTMGSRYLLVSVALAGTGQDFKTKVKNVEPQLRDMACGALATKTLADLQKPGIRNLIRSELLSGFNNILGGPVV